MTPDDAIEFLTQRQAEEKKSEKDKDMVGAKKKRNDGEQGAISNRRRAQNDAESLLKAAIGKIASAKKTIVNETSSRAKARWKFALDRITTGHLRINGSIYTNDGKVDSRVAAFWNWRFCFTAACDMIDDEKDAIRKDCSEIRKQLNADYKEELELEKAEAREEYEDDNGFETDEEAEMIRDDKEAVKQVSARSNRKKDAAPEKSSTKIIFFYFFLLKTSPRAPFSYANFIAHFRSLCSPYFVVALWVSRCRR